MNKLRLFHILAVAVLVLVSGCTTPDARSKAAPKAAQQSAILADDFNRADADEVGNGWVSKGSVKAVLKDKAIFFDLDDSYFEPRIERSFPVQSKGKFTVSFLMNWERFNEGTWGLFIQLGNGAAFPKEMEQDSDLAKGVAVNLLWGGGEQLPEDPPGSFGYVKDDAFAKLVVLNDADDEDSLIEKSVVTIDVNMNAATYSMKLNGKTYADLPFDNNVPIDTIRFVAHGASDTGFNSSSIDDVKISTGK